jgi:hypothetical protein
MIDGKEFKFAPDRIHGYQDEIDMDAARGRKAHLLEHDFEVALQRAGIA